MFDQGITMDYISKPSIMRLARRAGVKSISEPCYPCIQELMDSKLQEIVRNVLIINSEQSTKTIMSDNVYDALRIMGEKVSKSDDLGVKSVCSK